MQITGPKSHSLHNYHLKINCTDQTISVLKYLPVESSLTSGIDKLLQSFPVTRSVLTADSKEELTGFKGISFLVLLHMFAHNIRHGATANQQVALPMPFSNTELLMLLQPEAVMGFPCGLLWKKAGSRQPK